MMMTVSRTHCEVVWNHLPQLRQLLVSSYVNEIIHKVSCKQYNTEPQIYTWSEYAEQHKTLNVWGQTYNLHLACCYAQQECSGE